MLDFIKVYCDIGPGHDAESHILCGACADLLLDEDPAMVDEYGEVMDWERYHPRFDLPSEVYCDCCDACMDEYDEDSEELSDASDRVPVPCGDPCGEEPHGCLECDENPSCRVVNEDIILRGAPVDMMAALAFVEGFHE